MLREDRTAADKKHVAYCDPPQAENLAGEIHFNKITENLNPARIADWFCDREKRPVSCVYKTIHKDRENDSGYHIEYRMLF